MISQRIIHYLRLLKRNKLHSLITFGGLAIAMASLLVIAEFVRFEAAVGSEIPNGQNVYRIESAFVDPNQDWGFYATTGGAAKDAFEEDFAEVRDVVRFQQVTINVRFGEFSGDEVLTVADTSFFDVLQYPLIDGSRNNLLADPNNVVISRAMARKYFGDDPAVGQVLTIAGSAEFLVSGVFEDLPEYSHMRHEIVLPMDLAANAIALARWNWASYFVFAAFVDGKSPADIAERMPAFINRHLSAHANRIGSTEKPTDIFRLRFVGVPDIHFEGADTDQGRIRPPGNRTLLLALGFIGILIVAVAVINFATLASAQLLKREREMGIRKALGASRGHIFRQVTAETLFTAVSATLLAIFIAGQATPWIELTLGRSITLDNTGFALIAGYLAFGALAGLMGGIYPATLFSSTRPAQAFNPASAHRRSRQMVREGLVGLQFMVMIGLGIATLVMNAQMDFAENFAGGADRSNKIVVPSLRNSQIRSNMASIKDRVSALPDVQGAAFSSHVPGDNASYGELAMLPGQTRDDGISIDVHHGDADYLTLYDAQLIAGRFFMANSQSDVLRPLSLEGRPRDAGNIILNRSALATLGFADAVAAVGQSFTLSMGNPQGNFDSTVTVVGVIEDVQYRPIYAPAIPAIFTIDETNFYNLTVAHAEGTANQVAEQVEAILRGYSPNLSFRYQPLEERWNASYANDRATAFLIRLFSGIILTVACLGLFGLAAHRIELKTREIAIRKVFGASLSDVLALFAIQFAKPVIAANLIAWPLAWYFMNDWLGSFAHRVDVGFELFAMAGIASLVIAIATVSWHVVRVARRRPVFALRYE